MYKILVLISGAGSILKSVLDAQATPDNPFEVIAVGADRDAPGLAYAHDVGIPTFIEKYGNHASRESWGEALLTSIKEHQPDLVVLAGLMRILPANFVQELSPKLINTHPSLLPLYPGAHAVRDALAAGATESGVSIFVVDEGVDTGEILVQETVPVHADDDEATLHERIKVQERRLLTELLADLATGQRTL